MATVGRVTLARWDNPVSMPCDAAVSLSATSADHWGARTLACNRDAIWTIRDGENVLAFRCHDHRLEQGE
jgi:hypothetical protein